MRQLLKCSIEYGGLDDFVMTAENVFLDTHDDVHQEALFINYTSFVGLGLIKAKEAIDCVELT
jgi:hypothetical protein